jgi:(heptosyl)LPS beta-1,4-glucosyltransferase
MGNRVSVVLITKNEEANVAACLESVRWADEIVVIDSLSDDATVAISLRYTDKVLQRAWPGMVGPQRNVGLELTSSAWVLFLDADERVTEELRDEILSLVNSPDEATWAGAMIPRKNYFFGKWLKCSYPNYTSRLLRKGDGRYNEEPGRGFDTMLFSGKPVKKLKHPMIHMTGETLAVRVRKLDFDSSLQADEKCRAGQDAGVFALCGHGLLAFFKIFIFKRGFLDGVDGLIYAVFAAFSTFLKYAKLRELHSSRQ